MHTFPCESGTRAVNVNQEQAEWGAGLREKKEKYPTHVVNRVRVETGEIASPVTTEFTHGTFLNLQSAVRHLVQACVTPINSIFLNFIWLVRFDGMRVFMPARPQIDMGTSPCLAVVLLSSLVYLIM